MNEKNSKTIYEVVVDPYYKKTTGADSNYSGHGGKIRGLSALSKNYSERGSWTVKCRQRYVYLRRDRSKPTSLIDGNDHSSEQSKVLIYFGTMYDSSTPFKERNQ